MEYSRFIANEALEFGLDETIMHVRAHLSSVADADDDPDTHADDVLIRLEDKEDGVLVIGYLNQEPQALYLSPDYKPEDDGQFYWDDPDEGRWEAEGGYAR